MTEDEEDGEKVCKSCGQGFDFEEEKEEHDCEEE